MFALQRGRLIAPAMQFIQSNKPCIPIACENFREGMASLR
jgi:hypothetical protein